MRTVIRMPGRLRGWIIGGLLSLPGLLAGGLLHADSEPAFLDAFDVLPSPGALYALVAWDWNEDGHVDVALVCQDTVRVYLGGSPLPVQTGDFPATVNKPYYGSTRCAAVADLDGDGHQDLVLNTVWLPGGGDGTFGPAQPLASGSYQGPVAVGDLNGDGVPDVVVGNSQGTQSSDSLTILLGTGAGSFQPPQRRRGIGVVSIALGDVDKDGFDDIIVGNPGSPYFAGYGSISVGHGSATVVAPYFEVIRQIAQGGVAGVRVRDMNGDGNPDIVFSDPLGGRIARLTGHGDATFDAPITVMGSSGRDFVFSDLDEDGIDDLVTTSGSAVTVGRRRVDGTIVDVVTFWGPAGGVVDSGDLDGDSHRDVFVAGGGLEFSAFFHGNGDLTFGRAVLSPAPLNQSAVVVRDFNGDGNADLAASTNSGLYTQPGGGDGTFNGPPAPLPGMGFGRFGPLVAADFDGDGHVDLAALRGEPSGASGQILIFPGRADGSFDPPSETQVFKASSFVQANIGGDGRPDLVLVNSGLDTLSVFVNEGAGTFHAVPPVSAPGVNRLEVGDVNGDGFPDLVALFFRFATGSGFDVLLGDGQAGFAPPIEIPLDFSPFAVALGDLDGDGRLDVVMAGAGLSDLRVFFGQGDGNFGDPMLLDAGAPDHVDIGDVIGDGRPDIVASCRFRGTVAVLANLGDRLFARRVEFGAGESPVLGTIAELGGTATSDLLVGNLTTHTWTVLVATRDIPTPTLISTIGITFEATFVRVRWYAPDQTDLPAVWRSEDARTWEERGHAGAAGSGVLSFDDHDVRSGHTYAYRAVLTSGGRDISSDVATIVVPVFQSLAIVPLASGTAGVMWRFRVILPHAGAAHVALFDVAGRVLRSLDLDAVRPGRFDVDLVPRAGAGSGIFFARIEQGHAEAEARVVVLR